MPKFSSRLGNKSLSPSPCRWKTGRNDIKYLLVLLFSSFSFHSPLDFGSSAQRIASATATLQSAATTPPSPPASGMDVVSLSQHYAQIAHALRPFMPSNCCSLNPEDVKLVGARPMAAGGFADIWKAIYDGRRVALKSYRCYMSFDVTRTVEVHYNRSLRRVVHS